MAEDYAKKLQSLLRKLFQFESADLDFGIYRIMNKKRDVIQQFIDKDLIAAVEAEFGKVSEVTKASVQKEIDELKITIQKTLGSSALLPSGDFNPKFIDTPIGADLAKQYKERVAAYNAASVSDEHKAEIFNHIYQFFSRYYDNGDFMSMRRYSAKQKFAVPYNGEEVLLHWANKDQYYIKTGEYFFNYAFRVGEYTVRFQIVQAETSVNNTKGKDRFFVLASGEGNVTYDAKKKELIVLFEYRALTNAEEEAVGTKNKQDALNEQSKAAILDAIPDAGLKSGLTREVEGKSPLAKHLATYARRNTTDYFIHKNLGGFLRQELDFYIKNEMFDLDDLGTDKEVPIEQYLNRVRVMKAISLKIIDFLAQIEDFQKKLWEKKKFVIKSEYCMTLDRVPESMYPEIVRNTDQIEEWKKLYVIGESTGQKTLSGSQGKGIDVEFLKSHPYLVLDTKFFPQEFKDRLFASFDDLDNATGGLMIKSENWQALNLLQERYREQVKCIYIDPPYNTGSDEFIYRDKYQHSCWIALIQQTLAHIYRNLTPDGAFFSSIDDHEIHNFRILLNDHFGENNSEIYIWDVREEGNMPKTARNTVRKEHEYILAAFKNKNSIKFRKYEDFKYSENEDWGNPDDDPRGDWMSGNISRNQITSTTGKKYYSIKTPTGRVYTRNWTLDEEEFKRLLEDNRIYFPNNGDGVPRKKIFKNEPIEVIQSSIFENLSSSQSGKQQIIDLLQKSEVDHPKPVPLIKRIIQVSTENSGLIMDYFSGSGTTAHAVLNLNREDNGNRKYILVEMADYFDTVMKPRIQKVVYSSEWKDGKPQNTDGISHIFKYLILEQYEDTLNNIEFKEAGTVQKTLMEMDGYFLRYMLDFETRESPCRMNVAKLERPFEYTLRISRDNQLHNETVDLVETFNYLLGLKVKRIRAFKENGTTYRIVHGETLAGQSTTVIWRTTVGLDLKKDREFIEQKVLKDPTFKAERVYINGDFYVEGALPIEPEFQRLMGA